MRRVVAAMAVALAGCGQEHISKPAKVGIFMLLGLLLMAIAFAQIALDAARRARGGKLRVRLKDGRHVDLPLPIKREDIERIELLGEDQDGGRKAP